MVKTEFYHRRTDGVELYKTYSSNGFRIRQVETGHIFDAAIDIAPIKYTYEETETLIETYDMDTNSDYAEAGRILLGVSE